MYIIDLVLATDMAKHFDHMQRFKHHLPSLIQYSIAQVPSFRCHYVQASNVVASSAALCPMPAAVCPNPTNALDYVQPPAT